MIVPLDGTDGEERYRLIVLQRIKKNMSSHVLRNLKMALFYSAFQPNSVN